MNLNDEPSDHNSPALYITSKATTALIASILPGIGPFLHEILFAVVPNPIEKARERAMNTIEEAIRTLYDRMDGLTPEALANDETFITMIMEVVKLAARTSNQDKLEALKNGMVNSIIQPNINETKKLIFLRFLDRFTEHHLLALKFLAADDYFFHDNTVVKNIIEQFGHKPAYDYFNKVEGSEVQTLLIVLKELVNDGIIKAKGNLTDYFNYEDKVASTLRSHGIVGSSGLPKSISSIREPDFHEYEMTPIGREFFLFVSDSSSQ